MKEKNTTNHTTEENTMKTAKQMTKAQAVALMEEFAHIANSMQLALGVVDELDPKAEGEFWKAIGDLPEDIKESIIN